MISVPRITIFRIAAIAMIICCISCSTIERRILVTSQSSFKKIAEGNWRFTIDYRSDWDNGKQWKSVYKNILARTDKASKAVEQQLKYFCEDKLRVEEDRGRKCDTQALTNWVKNEEYVQGKSEQILQFREFVSKLKGEGTLQISKLEGVDELMLHGKGSYNDIYPAKSGFTELPPDQVPFTISIEGTLQTLAIEYFVVGFSERFLLTMDGYHEPFVLAVTMDTREPLVLRGNIYSDGYSMGSFKAFRFAD